MDFLSTVKGSLLEGFYPAGWDLAKIDACCDKGVSREDFWNENFNPVECESIYDFDTLMGHEIAMQIKLAAERGEKLAIILPVGPMGMYKWASYFLNEWDIDCSHVYTFNMDEWADAEGNTLSNDNPASFEYSMKQAFFGKINKTVPECQRNFATKENLPTYPEKIAALKAEGAKLVLVFGIGRMCHIAFWEPQFAEDYASVEEWKKAPYRI
ncbi:MAG: glucosamine-6-phosphate isomerase, partial [Clostridia bacterium]|nr:glucosamine-6-phosphate isomerase [Clostridia bacterium]